MYLRYSFCNIYHSYIDGFPHSITTCTLICCIYLHINFVLCGVAAYDYVEFGVYFYLSVRSIYLLSYFLSERFVCFFESVFYTPPLTKPLERPKNTPLKSQTDHRTTRTHSIHTKHAAIASCPTASYTTPRLPTRYYYYHTTCSNCCSFQIPNIDLHGGFLEIRTFLLLGPSDGFRSPQTGSRRVPGGSLGVDGVVDSEAKGLSTEGNCGEAGSIDASGWNLTILVAGGSTGSKFPALTCQILLEKFMILA